MAFTKTLFLSLLAILSVNTIAIAPIHAVGVGETWTSYTPSTSSGWRSVAYGNGIFVAVGEIGGAGTGDIMTSQDGATWTSQTTPVTAEWTSVAYGNGIFVVVSDEDFAKDRLTSTDGTTWTRQTSTTFDSWQALTFNDGIFMAIGIEDIGSSNSRVIITSPDGINWSTQSSWSGTTTWSSIAFGNNKFVAVGGIASWGGPYP